MIYITGDTHGDFRRFSTEIFPEQKEMTKDDFVIICGDFGGIWCQKNDKKGLKNESDWLDWLDKKPFTTLFVCGNHENFDRLYSFPVEERYGGKVHVLRPSVLHLMRGETFQIDGKKIFAFGGASSHDISDGILRGNDWKKQTEERQQKGKYLFRVENVSWWKAELPLNEEMENGILNLEKAGYAVDFVITHSPPASIIALLGMGTYEQDDLTRYLENIRMNLQYQNWFFGHMHHNIQLNKKDILLYEQIIRIA